MTNDIFRRVESKYLVDEKTYKEIMNRLNEYIEKDKFYESNILNIYFDTDNFELVRTSIEKPIYKEKIRLRSYNVPSINDDVFLEIKKKYDGVVNKRRITLKLKDLYDYLSNKEFKNNSQISKELNYCFKYYNLKQAMFLSYERKAYKGKDDSDFRLTFDTNVISRLHDINIEKGIYGDKILGDNNYIMEVKCLGAMPMWFVKILSDLKIFPASFSKYGNAYKFYYERGMINA